MRLLFFSFKKYFKPKARKHGFFKKGDIVTAIENLTKATQDVAAVVSDAKAVIADATAKSADLAKQVGDLQSALTAAGSNDTSVQAAADALSASVADLRAAITLPAAPVA